jgi:succinoglycan biosynthesis transport protein ExoP
MDGIQAFKGTSLPGSVSRTPATLALPTHNLASIKTPSHYLRALKRRVWLVLALAVPLAIGASILVLRLPSVYVAKAELEINPPEIDQVLSTLVTHDVGRRDPTTAANYVPNREAELKSRALLELVLRDPKIAADANQYADPVAELFRTLSVLRLKQTNWFTLSLEGKDPAKVKNLLETLLFKFEEQAVKETTDKLYRTEDHAKQNLAALKLAQDALDNSIQNALKKNRTIGAGGRNILEEEYLTQGAMMTQRQLRLGDVHQQMLVAQIFPKVEFDPAANGRAARLEALEADVRKYTRVLEHMQRGFRKGAFNNDPGVREVAHHLDGLIDEIESLRAIKTEIAASPNEMVLEQYQRELDADKQERAELLARMQDAIPEHQRILGMLGEKEEKTKQVSRMEEKLAEFVILRESIVNSHYVRVPASVAEPTVPIKPNRPVLLALSIMASLGLGIGLVCVLEHIDHSVTVPEHVTHGLTLPLLGVVPRIRRTALTHRGGHLWTPATPDSIDADAYRNVRASLLGIADKRGPIVTLLVTSAKAGEGKSTTALNLAAACARAGERTLLLDIDLRRPSLASVFIDQCPTEDVTGLVDVLRGLLPWQRTVRHTEIPNLDFIPTGDTSTIPIEILGTRELKQLLLALSHHYDRVILDGPAVLGLADCRVLGRMVDASLLVVRPGLHQLMTLHRAKVMLEQSHVVIAGVVFNGLTQDMNDWSSYGYEPAAFSGGRSEPAESEPEPLALAAAGR